jgi:hypothetical protein
LRHPAALLECVDELRRLGDGGHHHLEEAAEVPGRGLVGQHRRVLGRQPIAAGRRLVFEVLRGGHRVQPLAQVAGLKAGARGELVERDRPRLDERREQAEPVPDVAEGAVKGGPDVAHDLEKEPFRPVPIEARHGSASRQAPEQRQPLSRHGIDHRLRAA